MTASTVPDRAPNPASRPVVVLAFDTSTERLAIALRGPGGADRSSVTDGGAAASATLLPLAAAMLDGAGIGWRDLDAIAFGRGPGAFTGLRTACAVAQGLGFGLGVPLLPIDSLLVVAEDARSQVAADADRFDVVVAMDARIDEIYTARYRWTAGRWAVVREPALVGVAAFAALAESDGSPAGGGAAGERADDPVDAVAGSAIAAFGDRLAMPAGAVPVGAEADRARALLRLAVDAAASGAGVDAAQALPIYLRDRVALTTAEREAARAAAAR